MKTFESLMVLFFVFYLFVIPVSAFEDDFDDGDISDWNLVGSWLTLSGGMPTGSINYSYSVSDPASMTMPLSSFTPNYMSFWTQHDQAVTTYVYISSTQYIKINAGGGVTLEQTSGSINIGAAALLGVTSNWHKIVVERLGTNFVINVYDSNLNTITNEVTTPFDDVGETTEFYIRKGGVGDALKIDDVKLMIVSPSAVNGIEWDLDQYTEGDTASYTWSLQNSFWLDLIYKYRVQVSKDGVEIDTVAVSQTGIGFQDVDTAGTYEVKLQYSGLWPTNWVSTDSDSVNVIPEVDSYINVPQTEYTGNSFEISYLYGRTPILPFLKVSKRQIDNSYVNTDWVNLVDSGIVAGTTYTPNLTIYESGTYLIGIYDVDLLADDNSLLVASDTIRIFYQDAIEQISITKSKIDTNNISIIGMGDTLTGNYQVDSINYTNTSVRLEIYNYENDIISFSIPRQKQKGTYQAPLSNQEYFNEYIDGVNTVYKVDSLFYTGNNQVRLAGYDPDGTYNQTIVFVNFTIDYVNSAGYSLILSKYSVVQNEEFLISVMCPTESTLNIWDSGGIHIKEFVISGNKDIKFSLPGIDKYYFSLQDPSGNLQASQQLTVQESITPVEDEIETTEHGTVEMVITFLSMPAFWGMIIWVGVVGGASQKVSGSSTGYIAFALGNILAIVGLFAPYTMYILVILWIGAGVFFKLGRDAAGGEEY